MKRAYLAIVVAACTGEASRVRELPDAGGAGIARLRLAVDVPRYSAPSWSFEAELVRFSGVDSEAALTLAGNERPGLAQLAAGECAFLRRNALIDDAVANAPDHAAIQLLDAGEIVARIGTSSLKLVPAYVPEILPFVSGVRYGQERGGFGELAELGAELFVSADGGQDAERFDVALPLPAPALIRAVGGKDPAHGAVRVDLESDVRVDWSGVQHADDLWLTLRGAKGEAFCRGEEGGVLLPAHVLAPFAGAGFELAFERVQRVDATWPGLGPVSVEVAVRDVLAIEGGQ